MACSGSQTRRLRRSGITSGQFDGVQPVFSPKLCWPLAPAPRTYILPCANREAQGFGGERRHRLAVERKIKRLARSTRPSRGRVLPHHSGRACCNAADR